MNSRWNGLIVLVASTFIIAAATTLRPVASATSVAGTSTTWEYCEVGLTDKQVPFDIVFELTVSTATKTLSKPSWSELAAALGAKSSGSDRCAVFDYLGNQGWELTATLDYPNPAQDGGIISSNCRWIFKRPKR